jgi:hypothetical protein
MLARRVLGASARRKGVVAAASLAVVGLFVVGTAVPAWAHYPVLSGYTVCSDGPHVITWSIGNSEANKTMHIDSATATLGAQTFAVTGYSADVAGSATSATTTLPTGSSGSVTLSVQVSWPVDNFHATDHTSVTLISGCSPSTTTTTVAPTTTTTEAPTTTTVEITTTTEAPATTTTEAPTTTTTVETNTTEAPTTVSTTPVGPEGSTVPTSTTTTPSTSTSSPTNVTTAATPPGSLPFTGGSSAGPIFGLASLITGALALAFAKRRKHPLGS